MNRDGTSNLSVIKIIQYLLSEMCQGNGGREISACENRIVGKSNVEKMLKSNIVSVKSNVDGKHTKLQIEL